MRRTIAMMLACMFMLGCACIEASAADVTVPEDSAPATVFTTRATGSFEMNLKAYQKGQRSTPLPLAAGEEVWIRANYTPTSASVDFGLVDPDGVFHFINVTTGSIDAVIDAPENGNYLFAVRNNSSQTVKITGTVNY